jgi:hypothetical protein
MDFSTLIKNLRNEFIVYGNRLTGDCGTTGICIEGVLHESKCMVVRCMSEGGEKDATALRDKLLLDLGKELVQYCTAGLSTLVLASPWTKDKCSMLDEALSGSVGTQGVLLIRKHDDGVIIEKDSDHCHVMPIQRS